MVGVAASGLSLYVIGGRSGCSGLSLCECYNTDKKTWQPVADLNVGRSQVALCTLQDGQLVAVGGRDAWNCTNTVEMYDPLENKWSLLPPLAVARRGAGVALFRSECTVIAAAVKCSILVISKLEFFHVFFGAKKLCLQCNIRQ